MYVGASLIGNALFFCCLYNKYIYCSFALLGWLIFKHCGRFFNRKRPFFFLSVVRSPLSVVCCPQSYSISSSTSLPRPSTFLMRS